MCQTHRVAEPHVGLAGDFRAEAVAEAKAEAKAEAEAEAEAPLQRQAQPLALPSFSCLFRGRFAVGNVV